MSPIDTRRDISIVTDTSLRAVDTQQDVECTVGNGEPVCQWYTTWEFRDQINQKRAIGIELQPFRVARDHVLVNRIGDQLYQLRGVCGGTGSRYGVTGLLTRHAFVIIVDK